MSQKLYEKPTIGQVAAFPEVCTSRRQFFQLRAARALLASYEAHGREGFTSRADTFRLRAARELVAVMAEPLAQAAEQSPMTVATEHEGAASQRPDDATEGVRIVSGHIPAFTGGVLEGAAQHE